MTNAPQLKSWVVKRRVFDSNGDFIESIEVQRFNQIERPVVALKDNEALFQVVRSGIYDRRLSYPAAFGLTKREGI